MIHIVEQRPGWVELHASGKLTIRDYEEVIPKLEAQLEHDGRLSAMIVLHDFHGWTLGAGIADLRFDLRHRKDFTRMAVVGEHRLEKWATKLSAPFFSGRVRYYDRSREAEARAWTRGLAGRVHDQRLPAEAENETAATPR